jgi:ABC-2 type transport system permease protein
MEGVSNTIEVLKRELKSYFESPVAYVFVVVYLVLMGVVVFLVDQFYESAQANLWLFFRWHPWVYLLLVPAVSMRLWSDELDKGTIELLFTLPITPVQALIGKFVAAWLFLGLCLTFTFPVVLSAIYLGDPDIPVVITGYIGSFLVAGVYLSVGMFTSAFTRNQVISFVVTVTLCFMLVLAGYGQFTALLKEWAPVGFVAGIAATGVIPHFEPMYRGVLDIADIVYFGSVIALMLIGTRLVLENRR